MAEYKCICCGEIKNSDKDCTCPTCGYKMFPMPYERHTVLIDEITSFLKKFPLSSLTTENFDFYRLVKNEKADDSESSENETFDKIPKEKDDLRFPKFDKIQGYVCSAEKTERFCERVSTTVEQLKKYVHTPFQQEYCVDTGRLLDLESEREDCFAKALEYLGVTTSLEKVSFPEFSLDYCETPNEELLVYADELFDLLLSLSNKIKLFIKQNNIYDTTHQEKLKCKFKYDAEKTDAKSEIEKCIETTKKVLNKKYIVDIFSDGSDELKEMLKALWNSIYVCMELPLLNKIWCFSLGSEGSYIGEDFYLKIKNTLSERYLPYFIQIENESILSAKTDDELFEHLNQMIDIDVFGFFNVNKYNLMQPGKSEKELNKLIGLSTVKNSIQKIKAYAIANKGNENLNINMCFYGNPGTGKTEVARLIAGILYENKILPSNRVVEVDRSGLVSQYFGATAEKTTQVIEHAMGGVLFVDEAYALGNNSDSGLTDYGREAIDTLVKAMEDYRGKMCFIFAGYRNQMKDMIEINPGFKSRIQFELDFENYSRDELGEIADLMISGKGYSITENALNRVLDIADIRRKNANFANAREIRNIIDQVIMCQNIRNAGLDDKEIAIVDVNKYIEDSKMRLPMSQNNASIQTGEDELNSLIGLDTIKRTVKKIKAYAKKNKDSDDFNLHMSFSGNPGTGKTEVARIISRILYDAGVLSEAKVIETNAQGLLGKYVGETAPKTQKLIQDAMGGVLFIDEAYGLFNGKNIDGSSSFGDEAITVLLKSMEDHRGQFCVIFAGYKKEMDSLMNSNPGLLSRIQFSLEFPDYSRDELKEITQLFLAKKHYEIDDDALSYILDIAEYYRREPNFANARTIRNILDQVIMNQNLRVEEEPDNNTIIYSDVNDYVIDERIDITNTRGSRRIGF